MKAVVMGNGSSLNDMPEYWLGYPSYGCNYVKYNPTYYTCIDTRIIRDMKIIEYAKKAQKAYLNYKHKDEIELQPLYTLPNVELVCLDNDVFKKELFFTGFTVTYVMLKLAYYAGYDEVHLWGVDHNPKWKYYRDSYPPHKYSPPSGFDKHIMEIHYRYIQDAFSKDGRKVINHSLPSSLDKIFERAQ